MMKMRLPTKTLSRLLMVLLVFTLPLAVMAQKQGVKKTTKSSKSASQKKTAGGCIWNLTADTHITSFTGDASQIKSNSHRLYVNGKEMNIR